MDLVLVFHGSHDPRHVRAALAFARRVGARVAFKEASRPGIGDVRGDIYVPMFLGWGKDYMEAASLTGSTIPPIMEWPGFGDFVRSLGASLYLLHGSHEERYLQEVEMLGVDYAFLVGEPNVAHVPCPPTAMPLVLTPGAIHDRLVGRLSSRCPGTVLVGGPLVEMPVFERYFRGALRRLLNERLKADGVEV